MSATASALTAALSSRPVASRTTSVGCSFARRLTRLAMLNSVFATCQLSPLGRAATSRRSLETSIPTNTSVIRLVLRERTSLGPVLQIRAQVARATVRAAREQGETTELRHGLEWDQSPAAYPAPVPRMVCEDTPQQYKSPSGRSDKPPKESYARWKE